MLMPQCRQVQNIYRDKMLMDIKSMDIMSMDKILIETKSQWVQKRLKFRPHRFFPSTFPHATVAVGLPSYVLRLHFDHVLALRACA